MDLFDTQSEPGVQAFIRIHWKVWVFLGSASCFALYRYWKRRGGRRDGNSSGDTDWSSLTEYVGGYLGQARDRVALLTTPPPPKTKIDVKVGGTSLILGSKATLDRADIRIQSRGPSGIVKFTPDGYEATLIQGSDAGRRNRHLPVGQ